METLNDRHKRQRDERARGMGAKRAVVVLVCVLVVAGVLVYVLWQRAKADNTSTLADGSITTALADTAGVTPTEADGLTATNDNISTTVALVTSDKTSDTPDVSKAYLLVVNVTQSKAWIVSVDPSTEISYAGTELTLAQWVSQKGVTKLLEPLATSTGLTMTHMVVTDEAGWSTMLGVVEQGSSAIVSHVSELLNALRTDMDATDLTSLVDELHSIGTSNIEQVACPTAQGLIDAPALDKLVGALA